MQEKKPQIFTLFFEDEFPSNIQLLLAQLKQVRERLLEVISGINSDILDFTPDEKNIETIGTLLLHIAAVEWSWIFEDIFGLEMDFEKWKYAFPLRKSVNLPQLKGKSKLFYLNRLNEVRTRMIERLKEISDFNQLVASENNRYSIEWILFHLIEHESIHIGQISLLKRLYLFS